MLHKVEIPRLLKLFDQIRVRMLLNDKLPKASSILESDRILTKDWLCWTVDNNINVAKMLSHRYHGTLFFYYEDDAMAFKLRWL